MADPVQFKLVHDDGGVLAPAANANLSVVAPQDVGALRWPYEALPFTHHDRGNGFYAPFEAKDQPGPGQWLVVASDAGRSPVVQRLTLAEKGGVLHATAGWNGSSTQQLPNTAATVSIVNYEQKPGSGPAGAPKQSLVTIRLVRRTELVLLGSHDHLGGTRFDEFAKGRRNLLFIDKKIDDATIVTLFALDERKKVIFAKSAAPAASSWIVVGEELKTPIQAGVKRPTPGAELGMLDFYGHLNDVGRGAPGTVIEAGVFGHGFFKGPIVWGTFDRAASFVDRDPGDLDGRQKDWVPGGHVALSARNLKAAFHPTRGVLRSWGCNHMNNVILSLVAAHGQLKAGTARSQFFLVRLANGGRENMTLDHVKRSVAQYVVSTKIKQMQEHGDACGVVSYCGSAAQALGIPVFGSPPGMGSNFGSRGGNLIMHIVADSGTENERPMDYYKREFGAAFVQDDLNYLDYQKLLGAALPDPGYATERYTVYPDRGVKSLILRLPSGLELYRSTGGQFSDPVATTLGGISGHLYRAPRAAPLRVEDRGTDRVLLLVDATGVDAGVFVGGDGRSFLMRATTPGGTLELDPSAVPVQITTFGGARTWNATLDPPGALVAGLLEAVTPRVFW